MLKFFTRLKTAAYYPAAFTIISAQSAMARVRAMGKAPVVHFETPYDGQRIMLLALYEKGALRPDVMRLLRAARAEGLYILAINTLKLLDPLALKDLVDCYIERPNFGRDFGSYQTGFLHVFCRGWHQTCPRLLMVNDSIFFSEKATPKFLNDMMTSEVEVLGSTENFEIEYHLGSFCIAMAGSVLKQERFQSYWRKYRLSDVRPLVILRGEMKLSKTLKKCVSNLNQFRALYGANRYLGAVSGNAELLDFSIRNARTCDIMGWDRFSPKALLEALRERFVTPTNHLIAETRKTEITLNTDLHGLNETAFVAGYDDIERLVKLHIVEGSAIDPATLRTVVESFLVETFMQGSQIHQNNSVLLHMGLPIVKLDILFRGAYNIFDMNMLITLLGTEEGAELRSILMERPYGGMTLHGWKRAAFMRGLI